MKKIFSLLLVVTMIFSLCACGGSTTTPELSKEQKLEQAEDLKINDLLYEINNNMVKTQKLYKDKLVKIDNFKAEEISSDKDHATVKMTYWSNTNSVLILTANISNEDAMLINKGDNITVVGTLNFQVSSFAYLNDAFIVTD